MCECVCASYFCVSYLSAPVGGSWVAVRILAWVVKLRHMCGYLFVCLAHNFNNHMNRTSDETTAAVDFWKEEYKKEMALKYSVTCSQMRILLLYKCSTESTFNQFAALMGIVVSLMHLYTHIHKYTVFITNQYNMYSVI